MHSLAFHCSLLIAVGSLTIADGPLGLTLRERDPLTGDLRPLAGAQIAFTEEGPASATSLKVDYVRPGADAEDVAVMRPSLALSDASGECSFDSEFGHTQWREAQGSVLIFKPGFVMSLLDINSCQFASKIEVSRGHGAHLRLSLPAESKAGQSLACTVQFEPPNRTRRAGFGTYTLDLPIRHTELGTAHLEFEVTGFERKDSSALLRVPGFDVLEIGPDLASARTLRPARRLNLNVRDWETGEPIEGVRPVLRYGMLDEGGYFAPFTRRKFDHFGARNAREARLAQDQLSIQALSSEWVLLPGEEAAQLTNLAHPDYLPMIYVDQLGPASPTPITLLGPDSGEGNCTLYLRRWR